MGKAILLRFSPFSRRNRLGAHFKRRHEKSNLCAYFDSFDEYFYRMFVPFLWPKGRFFDFSAIWLSFVGTGSVDHYHDIHSGYFSYEKCRTAPKASHRAFVSLVKTKTFGKRFSVVRKIPTPLGSNDWLFVLFDNQKRQLDSDNHLWTRRYSQSCFKWPSLAKYRMRPCVKIYRFKIKENTWSIQACILARTSWFLWDEKYFRRPTRTFVDFSKFFERKQQSMLLSSKRRATITVTILFSPKNARWKNASSCSQPLTWCFFESIEVSGTISYRYVNVAVGVSSSRTFPSKLEKCSIFRKWTHVGNIREKYVWAPPAQTMTDSM